MRGGIDGLPQSLSYVSSSIHNLKQSLIIDCVISTVIQHGSTPAARQFAKYGCPPGLRGDVWKLILGLEVDDMVSNVNHTD